MTSTSLRATTSIPRVLVIDEEAMILRLVDRVLTRAGFAVVTAPSAEDAAPWIDSADLVLCDDELPTMQGSRLLASLRSRGKPTIVLMSRSPSGVEDAHEHGGARIVPKPFRPDDLVSRVRGALGPTHEIPVPKAAVRTLDPSARSRAHETLDRALSQLTMAFQPIVACSGASVFGYEALMRSREPTLPHPEAVLAAADALGRLHDVGRRVRELTAATFVRAPAGALLFLNLHVRDLEDQQLFDPASPLAPFAARIVLELADRAEFSKVRDGAARVAQLRARGFRFAIDDLGAGYAGQSSFIDLDAEFVKLGMPLIRGVDRESRKQRVVSSLIRLGRELERRIIAEGVETTPELAVLRELGCELAQGYFFACPGPPFPAARRPPSRNWRI